MSSAGSVSVYEAQPLPSHASGKAAAVLGAYAVQLPQGAPEKVCNPIDVFLRRIF